MLQYLEAMKVKWLSHVLRRLNTRFTLKGNFLFGDVEETQSSLKNAAPHNEDEMTYGCINSVACTVAQTHAFLWLVLGCVPLPLWVERLSVPWGGGETDGQIGHILWTTGTVLEEDMLGGVVQGWSRSGSTDVSPAIRGGALVTG